MLNKNEALLQPGKWLEGAGGYVQRAMRQLHAWAHWELPIHNSIDNECVPDFSCCRKQPNGRPAMMSKRLRLMFLNNPASRKSIMEDILGGLEDADPLFLVDTEVPGRVYGYARLEKDAEGKPGV